MNTISASFRRQGRQTLKRGDLLSTKTAPSGFLFALCCWLAASEPGHTADAVILQQPTATFSQSQYGDFSVARAIDGNFSDNLGWAIYPQIGPQTAVFETSTDIGFVGSSLMTFTLSQLLQPNGFHTLGRFRLSVTTDNRALFADGLSTAGDVTANWSVLDVISATAANGATLTELADHSILASGASPETDVYTVTAATSLTGITGIRLEALTDPALPLGGPGRQPTTGNFVLSEFEVSITPVPEPGTIALGVIAGLVALGFYRCRRRSAV